MKVTAGAVEGLTTVLRWRTYDDAGPRERYGATLYLNQRGTIVALPGSQGPFETPWQPGVELAARTRLGRRALMLRGRLAARRALRHLDHPVVWE